MLDEYIGTPPLFLLSGMYALCPDEPGTYYSIGDMIGLGFYLGRRVVIGDERAQKMVLSLDMMAKDDWKIYSEDEIDKAVGLA
jgi:hypothetical protein